MVFAHHHKDVRAKKDKCATRVWIRPWVKHLKKHLEASNTREKDGCGWRM